MTNITDIYWEANGLSLHTWAWCIDTFGGLRYVPAPKRGEDRLVPFGKGRSYVKKVRDSRTETLSMWLRPVDPDGNAPSTLTPALTPEQLLHVNWNTLMDAISVDGQFPLVKRWWGGDGTEVMVATAMAECLDFPEPSSKGKLQRFGPEMFLADPWFYGNSESHGASTFNVKGNETTGKVIFDLTVTGPCRVETSDLNWFEYSGGAGHLIVDSATGLATLGGAPVNGMMRKNKNFWRYAEWTPGPITVTFVSGISAGTVNYSPAYR